VMAVNTVIAAWYYIAVVRSMFFDAPEFTEPVEVPRLLTVAMGVAAILLVAGLVYPPLISELADRSVFLAG
ncbi:MAG: NADH-quinone oxidoreductase subunit NuoN, partial [Actinomycetota bacterium]